MNKEELKIMELYLENPISASKQDVRGEAFKHILVQMRTLLEEGKLLVKDKRREKTFTSIEKLQQYNFYDNMFWKLNDLEVKENKVKKELEGISLNREMKLIEQRVEDYKTQIDEKRKWQDKQEKEVESKQQEINQKREELGKLASIISGIEIILEN